MHQDRVLEAYITTQRLVSFAFAGFTESATRAASVKASLTPLFLIAEHSVTMSVHFDQLSNKSAYPNIVEHQFSLQLRDLLDIESVVVHQHRPSRVLLSDRTSARRALS